MHKTLSSSKLLSDTTIVLDCFNSFAKIPKPVNLNFLLNIMYYTVSNSNLIWYISLTHLDVSDDALMLKNVEFD
jgi:hypothetical protein